MKVLHVEDDKNWFERIVLPELNGICTSIDHAENYEMAVSLLKQNIYEYVILDQSIPLNDKQVVADVSFGISLADHIKTVSPGTPILFLTGQSDEEAIEKYVEDQEQVVFWDGENRGLVKSRSKRRLVKVFELIKGAKKCLEEVDSIELDLINGLVLTDLEKRVIRLFVKQKGAFGAEVAIMGGGYSSSKVLKITLIDEHGNECLFALAKIDKHQKVDLDFRNFDEYISKLPVGCFPSVLGKYFAGCGNIKGVFYQFANNYKLDYFSLLKSNQEDTLIVLEKVLSLLKNWENTQQVKDCSVKEIRQKIFPDSKLEKIDGYFDNEDLAKFEDLEIRAKYSIQHADLHGKNILVSEGLNPILIDYGDISIAPSVLDIVTLELSPFFHNDMSDQYNIDLEYFENWFNDDLYIKGSPFPNIASYLREMKRSRTFLNKDYAATIYAYALRQLSYKDTNHEIAKILITKAISKLSEC
ncbi:response regulator [Acinetobacter baumannii]|uniref:response regulator n=1 Tax=Acinetobacter baumannii TaxID=470 RepID=UPI00321A9F5E